MINQEHIRVISEAADLECSEVGEYWQLLSELCSYTYMMDSKFEKALEKEIEEKYRELIWKDEE